MLNQPFPGTWLNVLHQNVRLYPLLSASEQARLRDDLRILIAEKNWEGCRGLELTDEIRVTIAAQAALLTIGLKEEYFEKVLSILVYPDAFVANGQTITRGGLVLEGTSSRQGEAWYRGPVIVSWADALAGGRDRANGQNLVLHEFAHQLDMKNGSVVDGIPDLPREIRYDRWHQVIHAEFKRLQTECDRGTRTLLDCYGATHIGEFFAVSTECFFERAVQMKHRYPEWYDLLRRFFQQDPAIRTSR